MQYFLSGVASVDEMLEKLKKYLLFDLLGENHDLRFCDDTDLMQVMGDIFVQKKRPFVILIDEWDCPT